MPLRSKRKKKTWTKSKGYIMRKFMRYWPTRSSFQVCLFSSFGQNVEDTDLEITVFNKLIHMLWVQLLMCVCRNDRWKGERVDKLTNYKFTQYLQLIRYSYCYYWLFKAHGNLVSNKVFLNCCVWNLHWLAYILQYTVFTLRYFIWVPESRVQIMVPSKWNRNKNK